MGYWKDLFLGPDLATSTKVIDQVRSTTQPAVIPPPRPTDEVLTVETALGIAAVYRAVMIIVTSVSQMPLAVYRQGREIDLPPLIKNPNVNDSASGFIEETVFSLAAHGNAYWRIYRSGPGEPVNNIEVLDPAAVTFDKDEKTGRVTYHYGGSDLQRWQIKHLRLLRRPGYVDGLGPIQAAKRELTAALRLRAYADLWYSGVPTQGYLTTDQHLGPEENAAYAEAWKKFLEEHGVGILGGGLDYKHLNIDPEKAQFTEVQEAVITNIARLFGVPARHLLAVLEGNSMTYTNLETEHIAFLQTTLARYMNEIENALTDLLPRGQTVQFKEDGLLRLDAKTKAEVRKHYIETGQRTANEFRGEDGLEPLSLPNPAPVLPGTPV